MGERQWEIGICGTFDVANYGDLLFPLIAESELTERLGAVTLHRFSYHSKTPPEWPYEVTSVTALPRMIDGLDGLLIGGGFLIRFDKQVAPGYVPPAPEIHHPTGYWLTPALIALQHNVPLVWNAPGMDGNEIPTWAYPLMEKALSHSRYVAVRDEPSRAALERLTSAAVTVVPDTAFGLPRLLNLAGTPSAEFTRLCELSGLTGPYIVIQAKPGLEGFVRFLKNHVERFRNFRFLALPIGPALGDRAEVVDADLPGVVRLASWPNPLLLAELIGRSEAAVGHSYHLCITALAAGVPVFALHDLSTGKHSSLQHSEGVFVLPPSGEPDLEWFLARIGRTKQSATTRATYKLLADHWDRIASALHAEAVPTAPPINRFLQSLPILLEDSAVREHEATANLVQERSEAQERQRETGAALEQERAEARARIQEADAALERERAEARERLQESVAALEQERREGQERLQQALAAARVEAAESQKRLDEALEQLGRAHKDAAERQDRCRDMANQLTVARVETTARDARIAEILGSISWRLTAPLRFAGRRALKPRKRQLMNLAHIGHHRLETDPYRWAAIANLFNPDDAARLAATYPCDHFKLVAGYGGEKDYEYEARALIGMGEDAIAFPDDLSDAWRALASDLLSLEYRAAMTALTGCDLMQAPMEANVFHYGPGHSLGAHRDLPEKLVTQVLYFNRSWNSANGGCLRILRSHNAEDLVAEIPPIVGYSSVIVRSENSWHAVSRVADESASSRRSVTVTFYRPDSVSTMWPPGDTTPLHPYHAADLTP
jgi:hypothetical protein